MTMKFLGRNSRILPSAQALLLIALTLSFTFKAHALVLVVSDIDDTIKMSNIKSPLNLVYNSLMGADAFPYLIDIYQDIKKTSEGKGEPVEFIYLSASPRLMPVSGWLDYHGAPEGKIEQRGAYNLITKGIHDFKFYKLHQFISFYQKKLKEEGNGETLTVLMFGDNGQQDPQIFEAILQDKSLGLNNGKKYNGKGHAFARRVSLENIDQPSVNYFTSERDLLNIAPLSKLISERTAKEIGQAEMFGYLVPAYVRSALGLNEDSMECYRELGHTEF